MRKCVAYGLDGRWEQRGRSNYFLHSCVLIKKENRNPH